MKGRFLRLFIATIFFFSLIPATLLQQISPVVATPGWTQSGGMTGVDKYLLDSCVIKDGATYRMWYTHLSLDVSITDLFGYVKSLNLQNALNALQSNDFNCFLNALADLNTSTSSTALWNILDNMRTVIGYADSTDGKNWTHNNPNVLGTTGNFFNSVGFPSVIKVGANNYKMWYTSLVSSLNSGPTGLPSILTDMGSATESVRQNAFSELFNSTHTEIDYTTSPDGSTSWSTPATALAPTGGTWNILNSVGAPSVVLDGSTYKMWYTSIKTNFNGTSLYNILNNISSLHMSDLTGILNSSALVIGYATDSSAGHDGSTFGVVYPQVLPGASLSPIGIRQSVADPCVIPIPGGGFEMWYSNGVTNLNAVGLSSVLTSIKTLDIPSLWTSLQGGSLSDFLTQLSHLSFTDLENTLTGTSAVIGHAASTDGVGWTVQNSSELTGAATTPWSSVGGPTVVKSPTQAEIWFTQGIPALHFQDIFDRVMGTTVSLGYASTPALTSIAITGSASSITAGNTAQFTAIGHYSDSSTADLTSSPVIVWHSSNTAKATISASGLATGVDVGATDITASCGSVTSNALSLNVNSGALVSISVSPGSSSIPLGKTQQYTATGHYSDSSTADITNLVAWSSGNTGIATIGANSGLAQSVAIGGPVTITATLGAISGTSTFTVTAAVFDYLRITPDNPSVAKGDTLQLSAIAYNTDGTWSDHTADATWVSSGAQATVDNVTNLTHQKGRLTGVNTGMINITATVSGTPYTTGGAHDSTTVTVTPPRLVAFRIASGSPTSVAAGVTSASIALEGEYSDAPSTYVAISSSASGVIWSSSGRTIATVSTNGAVTGVTASTTAINIKATYLGFSDSESFTVTAPVLASINVLPVNPTITHPSTLTFNAIGVYSDGSTAPLTSGVGWSSGTPGTATIDAGRGLVATVAAGSSTITATVGSISGHTLLTVKSVALTSIDVTPHTASVAKGTTQQFIATGTYSDLSTAVITSQVSWTSSSTAVAGINANTGLATATAASGTSNITANLSGVTSNAAVFTASPAVVTALTVTPSNPSIAKGRTQTFTATATYSDGTTAALTSGVTWSTVAGTGTASLAGTGNGTATGTGVGTVTIQAANSSITGTTVLTVTPKVLASIAVTSTTTTSVAAGGTLNLVATGTYTDASTADLSGSVVWSNANSAVASLAWDSVGLHEVLTGRITSTSAVKITAALSGVSNYLDITVNPATVSSVTVDPVGAVMVAGNTRTFRAIANYTDGTKVDITTSANWASSDSAHATVGLNTGVVTGVSAGTANITATFNTVPSSAVSVTVISATVTLSSIAVTPATSIAAGRTQQFVATGTYSDASTAVLTSMVTWSSNNNAVATVIPGGLATSYTPGTATITATYGGQSGSAVLTISAAVLTSISVTPVNPQVTYISGAAPTEQFKATGVYSDGSITDITTTATWSNPAPDTGIATIIASGVTGGLATTGGTAGSTVITATSGSISGTSTLTVLADTVAPAVTITSPTAGLTTSNKNLTVTGNIDDIHAPTKQLILNGGAPVSLTLDGSGNFSAGVLLNNGSNTIQVKAIDGAGNIGQSATVTVKVDARKPAITITSPVDGILTNNSTVTIAGTATIATSVNVIVNGVSSPVAVTSGAFNTTATLSNGNNIICVTGYDPANATDINYMGTSGSRTVTLDTTPPVVSINSPINNSNIGTAGMTVSGTVDDPAVKTALLLLNGDSPVTIGVVNGDFSQSITLQQGANTIVVRATDAAGNTSPSNTRTVTLDTSKPVVVLTAPTNNLRTNAAAQIISGTVNDPSITTVALYVNGAFDNIPVISGAFSEVKTLNQGSNTIEARATNALSNTGSSGVFNIIVDTVSPVLTIGLTDPTASVGITVISNKVLSAPPTVNVVDTTTSSITSVIMTPSDINTYVGTCPVTTDDYTVTASGTDSAGNKGTANASFTNEAIAVDGVVPTSVTSQDTTLQVQTNGSVSGTISVTTALENPSGNVGNPGGASLGAGAFIEIVASSELQNNLNQIYIQVNYDPAQLPSGTDETTLKLYLWDVASGTWQVVPGSGVNTTDKYIYGTVNHLSTYGGFGNATTVVTPVVTPLTGGTTVTTPGTTSLTGSILYSGQFIKQVITVSDDGLCLITIPANTIGLTSTGLGLTQISMVKMTAPPSAPVNNQAVGAIYDFGPSGATFSPGITISIPYTDSQIPAGGDASKIQIAFCDAAGNWTKLSSVVDTVNHLVMATTTHFTAYALLVPTAPAAFTASNLTVSPAEAKPGDQVTISVKVSNTGDLSGKYTVTLKINNAVVDSKDVTLASGASSVVSFVNTQSKDGTYSVGIDNQTGQFVVKAPVLSEEVTTTTPVVPASLTISNLTVTPATVDINGAVSINVQVSNSGDVPGTYEVELKINNVNVTSKTVTVASKSTQTVTFTTSEDKAGTYTVSINGMTGTFTVAPAGTTITPPSPPVSKWPLVIGIIGGIIVVAALATVVLMVRRKK